MKRIEDIAAAHPKVGVLLSPEAEVVRGQLASIGFVTQDADAPGADWLITDGAVPAAALPVLRIERKVSIYALKLAIISLFAGRAE
ncbi:MAG TPA: hypothetical protein VL974_05450 [Magnetospirillum sp.]|jgi:hypothetical protein|nr:hypothetical protein [Magnetospirillum sp.]